MKFKKDGRVTSEGINEHCLGHINEGRLVAAKELIDILEEKGLHSSSINKAFVDYVNGIEIDSGYTLSFN